MPVALEFGFALVVILGAAVLFTNAAELLGGRLRLGQGAVGSVLAAAGSALPETTIPVVAIVAAVGHHVRDSEHRRNAVTKGISLKALRRGEPTRRVGLVGATIDLKRVAPCVTVLALLRVER